MADEIAKIWQEYNFDKVEMPKYNVLLPYVDPKISNKVQILDTGNNTVFEFSGKEKVIVRSLPRIFLVMNATRRKDPGKIRWKIPRFLESYRMRSWDNPISLDSQFIP